MQPTAFFMVDPSMSICAGTMPTHRKKSGPKMSRRRHGWVKNYSRVRRVAWRRQRYCRLAAFGATACCFGPLLLVTLGIGGVWVSGLSAIEKSPGRVRSQGGLQIQDCRGELRPKKNQPRHRKVSSETAGACLLCLIQPFCDATLLGSHGFRRVWL